VADEEEDVSRDCEEARDVVVGEDGFWAE